jgi:serine/threonine-protein kinase
MPERPHSDPTETDATGGLSSSRDNPVAGTEGGLPLPAGYSVLRALGTEPTSAWQVQLRDPSSGDGATASRLSSDPRPARRDPAGRLQLLDEIARGGMGAVLKGRDVDLGRDVAVKVLLEAHKGRAEFVQRFVEEARIGGQLQHPGVAPVYELGQLTDRRPYFTMKLVQGRTLAAELAARRAPDEDRDRFVGIFGQVCQTVAYAHSRGVIHRDLKPSNVMVGAFGEVQVMDWGLAKVLPQGGAADEGSGRECPPSEVVSVVRAGRGSDATGSGSQTEVGTVLGTLAYMSPEQARGDVGRIDERADVFGLGAILCEVLTGEPPFVGRKVEALPAAREGRLDGAFARLAACGADAELVALARRCLAAEPGQRPRDAGEVAAAVAEYQRTVTARLRAAELAGAEARARAEEEGKTRTEAEARLGAERRARRLTAALAAAASVEASHVKQQETNTLAQTGHTQEQVLETQGAGKH